MRIDAHQHYWKIDRGDYGWITPEIPVLYRDYLPGDLAPRLKARGIDGSIVVQAAETVAETEYLLELAEADESILGVVGWLDLFDPAHREHYDRYRKHKKFAGFRIMIQEMPDAGRILERAFVDALASYAAEDVPIDLLVLSHQLEPLIALLRQVPVRGVIDHIAKPRIRDGILEPWMEQMRTIAGFPNIYCKISGMVTEADFQRWKPEDFTPYIRHALDVFGSERVMFGSDWPVCLRAAEYEEVVDLLERAIPSEWGEAEQSRLFGGNAKEFYRL